MLLLICKAINLFAIQMVEKVKKTKQTIAKKMKMKRYVNILRHLKNQKHLRDAFKEGEGYRE